MIVLDKYFNPIAGTATVLNRGLKMITPVLVCVDRFEYDIVYSPTVPGNGQVAYRSGAGSLTFEASTVFTGTEKVKVLLQL